MLLSALFKPVLAFIIWQFDVLFFYLDPIVSQTPRPIQNPVISNNKWDFTFLFPFLAILLATLHGNVFMPIFVGGVPATFKGLSQTPALIFRQVYPPVTWGQSDIAALISTTASLGLFASFWRSPWTLDRYQRCNLHGDAILFIRRHALSRECSAAILTQHRRLKLSSYLSIGAITALTLTFIYVNLYLNSFYALSFNLALNSLLLMPLFALYLLYALFGIILFLILAILILRQRQAAVLSGFNQINDKLKSLKKRRLSLPKSLHLKSQNLALNRQLAAICTSIEQYAIYWKAPLTLFFLNHITLQSYLAYVVAFVHTIPYLQKGFFLYVVLEIDLGLFALIHLCSKLVKLNRRMEVANRRFYYLFLCKGGFRGNSAVSQQLKSESLLISGRLRQYAFHLFDNYRITTKTFYMVLSNISLFFLLVFKNAH